MNSYILEKLESLDKQIDELERDVTFMNKQIGKKLQKIKLLKEERKKATELLNVGQQEVNK